jgi:hypothetical protein
MDEKNTLYEFGGSWGLHGRAEEEELYFFGLTESVVLDHRGLEELGRRFIFNDITWKIPISFPYSLSCLFHSQFW